VLLRIACLLGEATQLSFVSSNVPEASRNSRIGSASRSVTGKDGPMPRMMIFFGCVPAIINPPIRALSPVPTRRRVERLARSAYGSGGSSPGVGLGYGGVG
jgi:hypothetical protein